MAQISLYLIITLFVFVLILGGGWYLSHRISTSEIDTLTQRNGVLTNAVETSERTIAIMITDAQVLAAANAKLTHSIMASDMEQAASWNAIDALDLASGGDAAALEALANDTFAASIDALRMATGK